MKVAWNNTFYYRADFDLKTSTVVITPSKTDTLNPQTTSDFAKKYHLSVAINGSGFVWVKNKVKPLGRWASNGHGHNMKSSQEITMYISQKGAVSFRKPKTLWNAISFPNWLIMVGHPCWHPLREEIAPRTIVGINNDTISFIVIEGIEGQRGATLDEAAQLCVDLGFFTACNMDGGGSSTLWATGALVNVPSDDNIPGHERPVANHIGVK